MKEWTARLIIYFTSNVDGAFQKAGFSEAKIIECHGSIHHVQYVNVKRDGKIWSADDIQIEVDEEQVLAEEPLPMKEGKLLRPNILMFGDWSWLPERSIEQEERFGRWLRTIELDETVVIEMGAGTAIPSVRMFSEQLQEDGATLIRINPRESHGPQGTISIADGAKKALQEINTLL